MAAQSQHQRRRLEDAAFALSRRHDGVMRQVHATYGDIIAALRNAQRERVAALRSADEEKLEEKRRQKQEAEQEVKQEVEQTCRPAQLLMCRNQKAIQDTCEAVTRVRKLQAAVSDLRGKLSAVQAETPTEAGDEPAAETARLRRRLSEARQASRKRLSVLALRTDAAAHKLRAVVATGEKVLQAGSLCGKMEKSCWPHGGDDDERLRPTKTFPEVQRLTRRLNAALLQQDALARRQEELRRHNRQLTLELRRRLRRVALTGGPALLAVKAASRHNVVEANDAAPNA